MVIKFWTFWFQWDKCGWLAMFLRAFDQFSKRIVMLNMKQKQDSRGNVEKEMEVETMSQAN